MSDLKDDVWLQVAREFGCNILWVEKDAKDPNGFVMTVENNQKRDKAHE